MTLENATLTYLRVTGDSPSDAGVIPGRAALAALQADRAGLAVAFARLVADGEIQLEGDGGGVSRMFGMLEEFETMFNIVEP